MQLFERFKTKVFKKAEISKLQNLINYFLKNAEFLSFKIKSLKIGENSKIRNQKFENAKVINQIYFES